MLVGMIIRAFLIVYSNLHDAPQRATHFASIDPIPPNVPYTDIDYYVYTDAAHLVSTVKSPFNRATYRYTPLLAQIIHYFDIALSSTGAKTSVLSLNGSFAKWLFFFADLFCGILLTRIYTKLYQLTQTSTDVGWIVGLGWWLNPLMIGISTRGNAESLNLLLILLFLHLLLSHTSNGKDSHIWKDMIRVAGMGIVFGLGVHWRLYPILYAPSILSYFISTASKRSNSTGYTTSLFQNIRSSLPTLLMFTLTSASTFLALIYVYYEQYGQQFMYESYTYHLERKDHRHNFSLWFLSIYTRWFSSISDVDLTVNRWVWFMVDRLPMVMLLGLVCAIALKPLQPLLHYRDKTVESQGSSNGRVLIWQLLATTLIFVAMNKVITSQYFVWYLIFLPLLIQPSSTRAAPATRSEHSKRKSSRINTSAIVALLVWIVGQALWLGQGYALEMQGQDAFVEMFGASIVFFIGHGLVFDVVLGYVFKSDNNKHDGSGSMKHDIGDIVEGVNERGRRRSARLKKE